MAPSSQFINFWTDYFTLLYHIIVLLCFLLINFVLYTATFILNKNISAYCFSVFFELLSKNKLISDTFGILNVFIWRYYEFI